MQKFKVIFLGALIVFGCIFYAAAQEPPFLGEINTQDFANVRAGANINYEIIAKLENKDRVYVLEKKFNWYKIQLPAEKAGVYINEKYFRRQSEDKATGLVLADRVNLRARPSLKATILAQANKADILTIIAKKGEWFEVEPTKDCFGWVKQELITKIGDSKNQPPTNPEPGIMELSGRLEACGRLFGCVSTHKLITKDQTYYLQGDKALLNNFLKQNVKVTGKLTFTPKKMPVITVIKIETLYSTSHSQGKNDGNAS